VGSSHAAVVAAAAATAVPARRAEVRLIGARTTADSCYSAFAGRAGPMQNSRPGIRLLQANRQTA
jgi:hypothetical protein